MQLRDQRVLVTGATAGIGQETARLFARRGAAVVITGRNTERGAQTVAAIEAEGGRAEFIATDLSDIESVRRLAEQVGEVDVLVNKAAVHKFAPTLEQDVESFTLSWAAAFGANGIRVNTVAPGPTRTEGTAGTLRDSLEQLGSATPLGRTTAPSEIAEAIVF